MIYKVGDKVRIRSWSDMKQEYGLDKDGDIRTHWPFVKEMEKWCGKVVTIKEISNRYEMRECRWNWIDDMINHDATKILSIIDRLEMLKKLTKNMADKIAIDGDVMILKSNIPIFSKKKVIYYNDIFRKLKGQSK